MAPVTMWIDMPMIVVPVVVVMPVVAVVIIIRPVIIAVPRITPPVAVIAIGIIRIIIIRVPVVSVGDAVIGIVRRADWSLGVGRGLRIRVYIGRILRSHTVWGRHIGIRRRHCLRRPRPEFSPMLHHGGQNIVGHSLAFEIDNFLSREVVRGRGALDIGLDDFRVHFGIDHLSNLLDAR